MELKWWGIILGTIAAIFTILGQICSAIIKIKTWINTPIVIYGFLDCPEVDDAYYYILVKARKIDFTQNITLTLNPNSLQANDYSIFISVFFKLTERQHSQTIQTIEQEQENKKIVNFELQPNKVYRIGIHCKGHRAGYHLFNQYDLIIEAPNAAVKTEPYNFPYKKYIK